MQIAKEVSYIRMPGDIKLCVSPVAYKQASINKHLGSGYNSGYT